MLGRAYMAALIGVLLFFFAVPLAFVAYAVIGPFLGSCLILGPLLMLQYRVYCWLVNKRKPHRRRAPTRSVGRLAAIK